MSNPKFITRAGVALTAVLASCITPDAHGIAFQNLGPDKYVFKLSNFDEGTLYNTQALNATVGVTNNPAAGAPLLDAATALQASNSHAIAANGNNLEDSWGIAFVQQIFRESNLVTPVWSAVGDSQQLTIMFYGAQDFFLKQTSVGGGVLDSQTISSTGLNVDLYLQDNANGSFTAFNQLLGPGARPADVAGATKANDASYPTVTDSNGTVFTLGVPVLTTKSTAGFLRGLGDLGGPATEFETTVNGSALNLAGEGSAYLSIAPTLGGVGSLNSLWNTNGFNAPHIAGNTADFSMQFTSTVDGSADWLVSSQDPVRGALIPEPTTALVGIGCMLPILFGGLGRRRKVAA
jgi:hypothetical protein